MLLQCVSEMEFIFKARSVYKWGFPGGSYSKEWTAMQETQVLSPCWEDPLGKGMATPSSILAWRIPWTEEPSGL